MIMAIIYCCLKACTAWVSSPKLFVRHMRNSHKLQIEWREVAGLDSVRRGEYIRKKKVEQLLSIGVKFPTKEGQQA